MPGFIVIVAPPPNDTPAVVFHCPALMVCVVVYEEAVKIGPVGVGWTALA
jgi:hypothetical protein